MGFRGAAQWLRLTKEVTWGTFATMGTPIWIRLTEGNSWVSEPAPGTWDVRGADGGNLRQQRGAPTIMFPFALKTVLYPAQAASLLGWGMKPTSFVLDSYTADWFDGVEIRRRLGCRVAKTSIGTNSKDYVMNLELSGYAMKDDTPPSLAQPAETVFVPDRPYIHQDSAGLVLYGPSGSPATLIRYDSIDITCENILDARPFESQYIQICDYNGRNTDWDFSRLIADNTARIAYQTQTTQSATLEWAVTAAGGYAADHSIVLNLQNANYLASRTVDRNFSKDLDEKLSLMAYNDPSTGTDMTVTIS